MSKESRVRSSRRGLYALEVHSFDWHLSVELACPAFYTSASSVSKETWPVITQRSPVFHSILQLLRKTPLSRKSRIFSCRNNVHSSPLCHTVFLGHARFIAQPFPTEVYGRLRTARPFIKAAVHLSFSGKVTIKKHSQTKLSDNSCRHTKFKINFTHETGHDYCVCICSRQWHHTHSGIESSYALLHYSAPFLRRTLYYSLNSF